MLELEQDNSLLQEAKTTINQLNREIEQFELHQLLCNPYDQNKAFLTINAGTDDADAQDWAWMLLRMYARWGEFHNYKVRIVEEAYSQEGIKSATLEIDGRYAYGYLKTEIGTHRVKRLSPFNPSSTPSTSSATVEVVPILDNSVEFEIPLQDLEIAIPTIPQNTNNGRYRWVRIVHLPTGIAVCCEEERTQRQNKEKAIAILKSKLYAIALSQNVASIADIQPDKIEAVSANPIREYIFHPYQMVKDLRTGVETFALAAVIDGKIDLFIKAYLHQIYNPN